MKVQIICRGSVKSGLGHLFRTKTFAKKAVNVCEGEVIAIVDSGLESLLNELGCPVHFVRRDDEILKYVKGFTPDFLVFDLTVLQKDVFLRVREYAPVSVSMSPIFEHMPLINLLFTRSARTPSIPGVKIFAGFQYAIFSENCHPINHERYKQNVLLPSLPLAVCMGGADASNKTLSVIRALAKSKDNSTIWVLLGEGYGHCFNELVKSIKGASQHEIILAKTNRSMWHIMSNCALAILSGGLTTIEAVYAGLPNVNLFERPWHIDAMSEELFELGVCINGGLFSEDSLAQMMKILHRLNANRNLLWEMHNKCNGLIDSSGSERVLQELNAYLINES
jgi:spore coat polysaccharide biosynthesis predicted glycosyltransferase SpsG